MKKEPLGSKRPSRKPRKGFKFESNKLNESDKGFEL